MDTVRGNAQRYERSLDRSVRRGAGVFYTPPALIDRVLDMVLTPVLDEVPDPLAIRVLDPACGAGLFLSAAARRIADRAGVPFGEVCSCLVGIDIDPDAIELASSSLPGADLRVANGLLEPVTPVDVVVGNPPFLNQLRKATTMSRDELVSARALLGEVSTAYTDVSALFLARSLQLVRPGGRVGLVQPLSVLSARDASRVRQYAASRSSSLVVWASPEPQFEDTSVPTCVVATTRGSGITVPATWGAYVAPAFGIPQVSMSGSTGRLGDLGAVTADFRDQYYGLRDHLAEGGPGHRLVTTGLIEPGRCEWGARDARIFKQRWSRPTVRPDVFDGPLGDWARRRLVPKVLIGTQGRIIEAVVDESGEWLPGVPVISMSTDRPWHALAVLCAPPVVAHAAATWLGTGMSARSIKLSARQVADLPLPADRDAWDRGAARARAGDLAGCARVMNAAYGGNESTLEWWLDRARLATPGS